MNAELQQLTALLALLPGSARDHGKLLGRSPGHMSAWYAALDGRMVPNGRGKIGRAEYRMPVQADVEMARALVVEHQTKIGSALVGREV